MAFQFCSVHNAHATQNCTLHFASPCTAAMVVSTAIDTTNNNWLNFLDFLVDMHANYLFHLADHHHRAHRTANTIGRRWTNVLSFLLSAIFCIPAILMVNCKFYGMQKSFCKSFTLVFPNEMNVIDNLTIKRDKTKRRPNWLCIENGQVLHPSDADGRFQTFTEHSLNFIFFPRSFCHCRCWMGILGDVVGDNSEILVVHFILRHKFAVDGNVSNVSQANRSVRWYNCCKCYWHLRTVHRLFGE